MIPTKAYNIILNIFPMIILFTLVMGLTRLVTILYTREKVIWYKELKSICFLIYIFALFELVTSSDFESYSNNFIPFKEIMRYNTTSLLFYRNVLGNIALFIPFGFLITDNIIDRTGKCSGYATATITLIISLTIEIIQMFIGRSFDIDDIMLNFLGGIIGFIVYHMVHIGYKKFVPDKYKSNTFKLIAFLIMVIVFVAVILSSYFLAR